MTQILTNGVFRTFSYKLTLSFLVFFFVGFSLSAADFKPKAEVIQIVQKEYADLNENASPLVSAVAVSQQTQATKTYYKSLLVVLQRDDSGTIGQSPSVEQLFERNHSRLLNSVKEDASMTQMYNTIKDELELLITE